MTGAGEVQTFGGPVDARELGTTLMHEHLFVGHPELDLNFPHPEWDEPTAIDHMLGGPGGPQYPIDDSDEYNVSI